MSPTVFRDGAYRFYLFSREEPRAHIHVQHPTGEAKFWIEPSIELARNYGLTPRRLATSLRLTAQHTHAAGEAWLFSSPAETGAEAQPSPLMHGVMPFHINPGEGIGRITGRTKGIS
jgi:hypothetical protein